MEFFKTRLIGALFVLGLSIIIIPAVFDCSGNANANANANSNESSYQSVLTQQLASAPHKDQVVIQQVGYSQVSAWSVRVGAFSNFDNASNLEHKLQEKGYIAYMQILPDSNLYGVFVGPERAADNAKIVLAQLNEELDLQGLIVPYEPTLYVQR